MRFDTASRALYATDASNYRFPPIGVVIPRTIDDIVATHAACREFGAPILSRGGGTSLSGETVNYAVVIDHSKYLRRVLEIDPDERWVHCETGAINEQVNEETGKLGLIFAPDPSTHKYCTIGGNLGNNSCGDPLGAGAVLRPRPAHLGQRPLARDPHLRRRAHVGRGRRARRSSSGS